MQGSCFSWLATETTASAIWLCVSIQTCLAMHMGPWVYQEISLTPPWITTQFCEWCNYGFLLLKQNDKTNHLSKSKSKVMTSAKSLRTCHFHPCASYHTWIQATRFLLELIPAGAPGPRYWALQTIVKHQATIKIASSYATHNRITHWKEYCKYCKYNTPIAL